MSDQGWKRPTPTEVHRVRAGGTRCRVHDLTYDGPAPCPACKLNDLNRKITEELNQARAVTHRLLEENRNLKGIVDVKGAMTAASHVMNEEDTIWIKTKLYEYKVGRKLILKTTRRQVGGEVFANGFLAQSPGSEPEAVVFTSIGGAALAEAYDEACSLHGAGKAMGLICDALWELLPGGTTR